MSLISKAGLKLVKYRPSPSAPHTHSQKLFLPHGNWISTMRNLDRKHHSHSLFRMPDFWQAFPLMERFPSHGREGGEKESKRGRINWERPSEKGDTEKTDQQIKWLKRKEKSEREKGGHLPSSSPLLFFSLSLISFTHTGPLPSSPLSSHSSILSFSSHPSIHCIFWVMSDCRPRA